VGDVHPLDPAENTETTANRTEVEMVSEAGAIESAPDVKLPTMADLDEVATDLDRIDAALVALDQQR